MSTLSPVYLIDASIYIFRAYFAFPDRFFTRSGKSVNAVCGYSHFLAGFLNRTNPSHIAAGFDESLFSGFRHKIYEGYKANRGLPDSDLEYQLKACKRITEAFGIPSFSSKRYEADDLLGSLAANVRRRSKRPITFVTRDKDLTQLLDEQDSYWDYAADKKSTQFDLAQQWGFALHQVPDFLALAGDSADNIPGVKGVGVKTAKVLMQQFDSLESLYAFLSHTPKLSGRGGDGLALRLLKQKEDVFLFRQLTTIRRNVPLKKNLNDLVWALPNRKRLERCLDRYEVNKPLQSKLSELYERR